MTQIGCEVGKNQRQIQDLKKGAQGVFAQVMYTTHHNFNFFRISMIKKIYQHFYESSENLNKLLVYLKDS